MSEAAVLELTERHLGDESHPDRHEREVLPGVPSASRRRRREVGFGAVLGPTPPRMPVERIGGARLEFGEQFGSARHAERRGHTHRVHLARFVEQAEQQRADALAVLVDAVAGDRAVGGSGVLHLDERALARLVGSVDRLGDDAIEAGALEALEPFLRAPAIGARRREMDDLADRERSLEYGPPVEHRQIEE